METNYLAPRHLGVSDEEIAEMLTSVGVESIEELINKIIPSDIRLKDPLKLPPPLSENEYIAHINSLADKNKI